jgi:hypothetical protein
MAAQTDDEGEFCLSGHRFAPGPVVNGRHRQPTQREIEARMRELRRSSATKVDRCAATSRRDAASGPTSSHLDEGGRP